jgi:hypothetical protein
MSMMLYKCSAGDTVFWRRMIVFYDDDSDNNGNNTDQIIIIITISRVFAVWECTPSR